MSEVVVHALMWGVGLAAYLTVAVLVLLRLEPEMWLGDYPPDVREAFGPMSPRARRLRLWLGGAMMLGTLALIAWATGDMVRTASPVGFLDVALHTFVLLMVFNVVDLVLIDGLFFVYLQPSFIVLPGTDGMAGYDAYGFHGRAFLKGVLGIVVGSVLCGLLVPPLT